MIELSCINVFAKKDSKKERRKERKNKRRENNEFCTFRSSSSSSGDIISSIDIPNTTGNVQEYLVSLLYKQNEPVCGRYTQVSCNIYNEVANLKLTQPYFYALLDVIKCKAYLYQRINWER